MLKRPQTAKREDGSVGVERALLDGASAYPSREVRELKKSAGRTLRLPPQDVWTGSGADPLISSIGEAHAIGQLVKVRGSRAAVSDSARKSISQVSSVASVPRASLIIPNHSTARMFPFPSTLKACPACHPGPRSFADFTTFK